MFVKLSSVVLLSVLLYTGLSMKYMYVYYIFVLLILTRKMNLECSLETKFSVSAAAVPPGGPWKSSPGPCTAGTSSIEKMM